MMGGMRVRLVMVDVGSVLAAVLRLLTGATPRALRPCAGLAHQLLPSEVS